MVSAGLAVQREVEAPIIGFHATERLGHAVFGDENATSGAKTPPVLRAAETVDRSFTLTFCVHSPHRNGALVAMDIHDASVRAGAGG